MKTTLRFISISLVLGLAGALTAAWGAESVIHLISQGESIQNKVRSTKAALDAATQYNNSLATQGKKITVQQQQLQSAIAAYKQQVADVKTETAKYKSTCEGKQLNQEQYKSCKAMNAKINTDIAAVNTTLPKLNKQQDDLNARAVKYNHDIQAAPGQVRTADANYRNAFSLQESWLDQARNLVASPAFQPYAKKAGCPNVMQPPTTMVALLKMSDEILVCLKKVVGTN